MIAPPSGQLAAPDYLILAGYFTLMLGIGIFFSRYMRSIKDYFSGGNRIPWWLSGVSFYMATFSAFGFVSYSALAYLYGWVAVTIFWICAAGTITSVIFFSRKWRRARIDSPVEYLETRYSPAVRQIFAWQGLPVRLFDDTFKLIAIGVFVSKAFNVEMVPAMVCSGGVMLAYTLMGGLWAVAVTDFIQFIIMAMAVIALVPLALHEVGGFARFVENSPEGFFRLTSPDFNTVYILSAVLLYMLAYSSVNWALIQRYYCVPTERDTVKTGLLVIALQLIGPPLILLPAMAARQFLPGIEESAQVYPRLCLHLLPAGMAGLVVAAMFSSTLSTLSGDYNVCSSVLTNDIYRRMIRPNRPAREYVLVGRLMTLLVGGTVIALAVLLKGMTGEGLVRNMFKLFGIATAPVAIPMALGLLTGKVTNRGALAGFFCGITAGIAIFIWSRVSGTEELRFAGTVWKVENILLAATTLISLAATAAASLTHTPRAAERRKAEAFMQRLQTPIGETPEERQAEGLCDQAPFSPFKIVGVCILLIGVMMLCVLPMVQPGISSVIVAIFTLILLLGGALILALQRRAGCRRLKG
jgi:solute:Na+ symporter, SSS family